MPTEFGVPTTLSKESLSRKEIEALDSYHEYSSPLMEAFKSIFWPEYLRKQVGYWNPPESMIDCILQHLIDKPRCWTSLVGESNAFSLWDFIFRTPVGNSLWLEHSEIVKYSRNLNILIYLEEASYLSNK